MFPSNKLQSPAHDGIVNINPNNAHNKRFMIQPLFLSFSLVLFTAPPPPLAKIAPWSPAPMGRNYRDPAERNLRCFCLFPKKALLFSAGIEFGAVLGQTKNRYTTWRSGRGVHKSNTTMILWHYYSQTPRHIMRRV